MHQRSTGVRETWDDDNTHELTQILSSSLSQDLIMSQSKVGHCTHLSLFQLL